MSETASTNRWIPFQCPSCFGLFRIKKSQVGQIGRCPVCSATVQSSERGNSDGLEQVATQMVEYDNFLDKVAVAKEMTPEEIEKLKSSRKIRRPQNIEGEAEGIAWEQEVGQDDSNEVSWKIVVSIVLSALVLLALSIFYYQRSGVNPNTGSNEPVIDREKADALLDGIEEAERNTKKVEEGDLAAQTVDEYKKFDVVRLEETIKNFVTAESPEERKKFIRDAQRVGPALEAYYKKVEYEPEGFESLNKLKVSYRGELLTTLVTTADFLSSPIAVERFVDDGKESYKVDWESWVGYCDFTPEEMREKKPDTPFLMRVIVEPANYYNYGFSDDRKWRSLGLELRDSVHSFLGYVARDSKVDKRFRLMMKNKQGVPCLIKVAYPRGSRAKDQVEILEIVTEGWVINLEEEEKGNE